MKTEIKKINGHELSSFIKKLLPIDKFIYITIGPKKTTSSVYFPEKDAVKLVNVDTEDLFDIDIDKPIKVSFYNGTKVVDALTHFNGEIQGSINYNENDDELMASDFTINDTDLTINLACADPSLSFMELSKENMKAAFGTTDSLFKFDLLDEHITRMKSLFNLEKDIETFNLYVSENGVAIKGHSYDADIVHSYDGDTSVNTGVTVYKKYLNLLDKENYSVTVCENKIVFKSLDTDTLLTISVAFEAE